MEEVTRITRTSRLRLAWIDLHALLDYPVMTGARGARKRIRRAVSGAIPKSTRLQIPHASHELEQSDAVQALLHLPAAVMLVGGGDRVVLANDHAAVVLGTPAEQLNGRSAMDVLGWSPSSHEDDDRTDHEWVMERRSGQRRTLKCNASRFPLGDGEYLHAVVFQDITREKELREERDRLLRLATLGEALPSLLHELKNPLAAVTVAAEVLVEELEDEGHREQVHAILSEVRRMKLGFDGIGALDRTLRSERNHAVDYACREACRVLEARTKRASIHFRYDIEMMPLLPFDPGVMRALLFNFVTNAIHACDGGCSIHVAVRFERHSQLFVMTTVDTGSGMSPETLNRATELFFSTKPSGSGIGLALCRRAVEGAGGTLEIASVPGTGTEVSVVIPLHAERVEDAVDEHRAPKE